MIIPQSEKHFLKTVFLIFAAIALVLIVAYDLDRPGEGYIKWVVLLIISGYEDVKEITHTPLASLTIAKILLLIFDLYVAWLLLVVGKAIWCWINGNLEELEDQ